VFLNVFLEIQKVAKELGEVNKKLKVQGLANVIVEIQIVAK